MAEKKNTNTRIDEKRWKERNDAAVAGLSSMYGNLFKGKPATKQQPKKTGKK